MEIEKIYIDMDGVLADFDRGFRELCGMEPVNQSDPDPTLADVVWDNVRKVPHYYDKLEVGPGAGEMFRILYETYGDKCEILSAIPKPHRNIEHAKEDKINWVKRELSDTVKINIVYRAEKKQFCTSKGCILIDDFRKNIREWEEAGGTGILYTSAADALEAISKLTDK